MTSKPQIYCLNGPNLNMLGTRQPEIYGKTTLADIEADMEAACADAGFELIFKQTNHEGELVEHIQEARAKAAGLIINPGAYTHTSIAMLDALLALDMPIIEVHLSHLPKREDFRQISYAGKAATASISGLGAYGYRLAILAIKEQLG